MALIKKPAQPQLSRSTTIESLPATDSVKSVSGTQMDIGESKVTGRAKEILNQNLQDEEMTWQESPSLLLLIPRFCRYAVIMLLLLLASRWVHNWMYKSAAESAPAANPVAFSSPHHSGRHGKKPSYSEANPAQLLFPGSQAASPFGQGARVDRLMTDGLLGMGGLFFLMLLTYLLGLRSIRYSATSQRLFVEEGLLHAVNQSYELHQLGDAVLTQSFLMRPFGIANLVIAKPSIVLYGLRNAAAVRDLLRTGGQLEAQRANKIRWR